MSIGLVMFGKALIVSLWGALTEAWLSYRKRRAATGIPLRRNKAGVYVPHDWTAKVEAFFRGSARFAMVALVINLVVMTSLVVFKKLS